MTTWNSSKCVTNTLSSTLDILIISAVLILRYSVCHADATCEKLFLMTKTPPGVCYWPGVSEKRGSGTSFTCRHGRSAGRGTRG
jgi:hypothetical protein